MSLLKDSKQLLLIYTALEVCEAFHRHAEGLNSKQINLSEKRSRNNLFLLNIFFSMLVSTAHCPAFSTSPCLHPTCKCFAPFLASLISEELALFHAQQEPPPHSRRVTTKARYTQPRQVLPSCGTGCPGETPLRQSCWVMGSSRAPPYTHLSLAVQPCQMQGR